MEAKYELKVALNGGNEEKAKEIAKKISANGEEWVAVMQDGCFADNISWICYGVKKTDSYVKTVVTAKKGKLWA